MYHPSQFQKFDFHWFLAKCFKPSVTGWENGVWGVSCLMWRLSLSLCSWTVQMKILMFPEPQLLDHGRALNIRFFFKASFFTSNLLLFLLLLLEDRASCLLHDFVRKSCCVLGFNGIKTFYILHIDWLCLSSDDCHCMKVVCNGFPNDFSVMVFSEIFPDICLVKVAGQCCDPLFEVNTLWGLCDCKLLKCQHKIKTSVLWR